MLGDEVLARRLEIHLAGLEGVVHVVADADSGRVLISYGGGARPNGGGSRPASRTVPAADDTPWHALPTDAVLREVGVDAGGLTSDEAAMRIVRYGANVADVERGRSRLEIAAGQFANLPTVLLFGGAVVSLALGDFVDAGVILLVVGANAVLGYRIERKNEQLLASWRRLEAGAAKTLRDGAVTAVAATELVPGDVVLLLGGDIVPADARVIDAHRLAVDEAPLTGESDTQRKGPDAVVASAPLADRTSMVFAGTTVVAGRGRAVVVATGRRTEVAGVKRLVTGGSTPQAPLERRLADLGRKATIAGLCAAGVMFFGSVMRGRPLAAAMRGAVALGVAAIPEGMPVVATAALVNTMNRMRAKGMVVRRVVSAETLGGVTVVCMDKTGTLTRNDMRLEVLELDGQRLRAEALRADPAHMLEDPVTLALAGGVLNSDIEYHDGDAGLEITGSATERALVLAAQAAGLDPETLRRRFPRLALQERQDGIHYVVSLHDDRDGGGRVAFLTGGPEQVGPLCDRAAAGPLAAARRTTVLQRNDALASAGHRVLALAWTRVPGSGPATLARPLPPFELLGLVGLRDPLRAGAREALATASRAGIRTLILTGDQRATAAAIAREVGLAGTAVEGGELARRLEAADPTADGELARAAVLARVSPADKAAIITALRHRGEIVAMVGDGINDAPALKVADVGIAVGAHASDIARQTADVVLENAELRSILAAVGEGRIVQDNLRRAIRYLFASNFSEIAVSLVGLALGHEPLTSLQLLWINLVTDTLPALALALEPGEPEVLARRPAPPNAPLLARDDWRRVLVEGGGLAALGGAGYAVGASTGAFSTLVAAQLGYALTCRASETRPDRRFLRLLGTAIGLQGAVLMLPPLGALLRLPAASAISVAGFVVGLSAPVVARTAARLVTHSPALAKG